MGLKSASGSGRAVVAAMAAGPEGKRVGSGGRWPR